MIETIGTFQNKEAGMRLSMVKRVNKMYLLVCARKLSESEAQTIREKFACWRNKKLLTLVRLETQDFGKISELTSLQFTFVRLNGDYFLHGGMVSQKEVDENFPSGISEDEFVIKLALPKHLHS